VPGAAVAVWRKRIVMVPGGSRADSVRIDVPASTVTFTWAVVGVEFVVGHRIPHLHLFCTRFIV
jgi:hypothetical protein